MLRPSRQLFSWTPPKSCLLRGFSSWALTKGLQKPSFAKVPKTLVKPHFWRQIAVLHKRQRCRAPPQTDLQSPSRSCLLRGFSSLGLTGGLRKPSFAKVPKTLVKPHFWSQIAVLPKPQRVPRPPRRLALRTPPNHAFYEVSAPGASQGACESSVLPKCIKPL